MFNNIPLFQILAVMGSVLIILSLVELVRRRKLKENYSLLWFAISFVFLIFSLRRDLLTWLANLLGVDYAPAAIFLLLIAALYLLSLNFSIVLSGLSERNKELAQKAGLLEMEIKKLKEKTGK
ncbi:MAG: DUF2304 domain-containing protein [Candidatus Nealsonbacteria bacterium]|nr:DUF2304 domain-containing protein [Candidatus Nealsonbacteria bacterium]